MKYIRYKKHGMIIWPNRKGGVSHKDMSKTLNFEGDILISAGFILINPDDNNLYCYGESLSLRCCSTEEDSDILRKELL